MLVAESTVTTAEEGCSKGEMVRLKRVWPPSVGCGHDKTEALKEVRCCNPILDSPRFS